MVTKIIGGRKTAQTRHNSQRAIINKESETVIYLQKQKWSKSLMACSITHARTHARARAHTHTHMHARTHTHTLTTHERQMALLFLCLI